MYSSYILVFTNEGSIRDQHVPIANRSIIKSNGAGANPARPPKKDERKDQKSDSAESSIMKQVDHPSFS